MAFPEFEAIAPNATMRPAINAVDRIVDEAVFTVERGRAGGLFTKAVDAANVAMVDLDVPAEAFESWDVEKPGEFGINTEALLDALKDVNKRDLVKLSGDVVAQEVTVTDMDSGTTVATIDMFDPDATRDKPDIPDLDWKTTVEVPGDQYSRIVRAADEMTDHLVMGVGPEGTGGARSPDMEFQMIGEGDVDEIIGYPDQEFIGGGEGFGAPTDTVGAFFSMDYLKKFRLGIDKPASTDVRFEFPGIEFPLRMTFEVGDEPGADVLYFLAPRIQSHTDGVEGKFTKWETDTLALDTVDFRADMDGERGKEMFPLFGTFVDEYKLLVNEVGMETRAVDPSNVAMQAMEADPDYFDSFEEVDGFPQGPVGIMGSKIEDLIRKWRKGDDMEFATDKTTRMMALKHDIFTTRHGLIDPKSIRAEPDLPSLDLTSVTEVNSTELEQVVDGVLDVGDHWVFVASDGEAYAVNTSEEPTAEKFDARTSRGRAFGMYSGDYTENMLDTLPSGVPVDIRAGVEFPIVVDADIDGGNLNAVFIIAPRVTQSEDADADAVAEVRQATGLSLDWIDDLSAGDFDAGDVKVAALSGVERKSIEERMKEKRLSTFPIESSVSISTMANPEDVGVKKVGTREERGTRRSEMMERDLSIRLSEAEDMGVPDSTINDALNEIAERVEFEVLDTGERVAEVTFTSEQQFDIELLNVEPETEHALTTDDGFRVRSLTTSDDDRIVYHSNRTETPARNQVRVAAQEDPDGDSYGVYVWIYQVTDAQPVETDMATIGNAYARLEEYVRNSTLENLVLDGAGEIVASDREVQDELKDIVDRFVGFDSTSSPVQTAGSDVDFYAAYDRRAPVLPDAKVETTITVHKPDDDTDGYKVSYSLTLRSVAPPGTANRVRDRLVSATVGVADTKGDIPPLVEQAFEAVRDIGKIFAPTSRDKTRSFPNPLPREGDIREFVDTYLPAPKSDLEQAMRESGFDLPIELTDVDRVGSSRAEELEALGITDMLDLTALLASVTDNPTLQQTMAEDLPDRAANNLQEAAGRIWENIIWPRREMPGAVQRAEQTQPEPTEPEEAEEEQEVAVTVVSPFRPLTREARDALEEFGIIDTRSVGEAGRQTEVDMAERPPESVLEEHELFVDEDPLEVWETDRGKEVKIFPTVVVAEGQEVNMTREEAAERVREQDNFSPVTITDESPFPPVEPDETEEFRDARMRNAHYWAAQARGFMEEQVSGLRGEWFVEIVAGQAVIVMSDEFPEGSIDALTTELRDHNFPEFTVRELEDETRIFIQPSDDRLVSNLVEDWRDFESGSFGAEPEGEPAEVPEHEVEIKITESRADFSRGEPKVGFSPLLKESSEVKSELRSRTQEHLGGIDNLSEFMDQVVGIATVRGGEVVEESVGRGSDVTVEELHNAEEVVSIDWQVPEQPTEEEAEPEPEPAEEDQEPEPTFPIEGQVVFRTDRDEPIQIEDANLEPVDDETVERVIDIFDILTDFEPGVESAMLGDVTFTDPDEYVIDEREGPLQNIGDKLPPTRKSPRLVFTVPGGHKVEVYEDDVFVIPRLADAGDLPIHLTETTPEEAINLAEQKQNFTITEDNRDLPEPEPKEEAHIPQNVGVWTLADETDNRISWVLDELTVRPPATLPRDVPGKTFIDVRQGGNRWFVRARWELENGEQETSRRAEFTVGDAKQKAIDRAVELMQEFQPSPEEIVEEPEEEPQPEPDAPPEAPPDVEGTVTVRPKVVLEGGDRAIQVDEPGGDIDLSESLKADIRDRVRQKIGVQEVPAGESLGEVVVGADGIQSVDLSRAERLMMSQEEREANQLAEDVINILEEE